MHIAELFAFHNSFVLFVFVSCAWIWSQDKEEMRTLDEGLSHDLWGAVIDDHDPGAATDRLYYRPLFQDVAAIDSERPRTRAERKAALRRQHQLLREDIENLHARAVLQVKREGGPSACDR